jgi:hypothetical protein
MGSEDQVTTESIDIFSHTQCTNGNIYKLKIPHERIERLAIEMTNKYNLNENQAKVRCLIFLSTNF